MAETTFGAPARRSLISCMTWQLNSKFTVEAMYVCSKRGRKELRETVCSCLCWAQSASVRGCSQSHGLTEQESLGVGLGLRGTGGAVGNLNLDVLGTTEDLQRV